MENDQEHRQTFGCILVWLVAILFSCTAGNRFLALQTLLSPIEQVVCIFLGCVGVLLIGALVAASWAGDSGHPGDEI